MSVKKPTVHTDRPNGPAAIRYTSVDIATHRPAIARHTALVMAALAIPVTAALPRFFAYPGGPFDG